MFVACGIWCLADVSSDSPSSENRPRHTSRENRTYLEKFWRANAVSQAGEKHCAIGLLFKKLNIHLKTKISRGPL